MTTRELAEYCDFFSDQDEFDIDNKETIEPTDE